MFPCEICEIFKNAFFNRIPLVTASVVSISNAQLHIGLRESLKPCLNFWSRRWLKLSWNDLLYTLSMIKGDTHMTSTLRVGGWIRQKWDVIRRSGESGYRKCSIHPIFFLLLLKKIGLAPWSCWVKQYITDNKSFYWLWCQWSHSLMIPLHCLRAKSSYRTRDQFEFDVTWFCFCFDFVCSHTRCSYYSIVCWRGWEEGAVHLTLDVQGQEGGKILDVVGLRGGRS